jgi:hypothetical protein
MIILLTNIIQARPSRKLIAFRRESKIRFFV